MSSAGDTRSLIEATVARLLEEIPALKPLKLVVGLDLRGRGDVQQYRIELPGPQVSKDMASDARVRVEVPRIFFNELAKDGRAADWREAFHYGQAKASGPSQILRLIEHVVDRQEERARTRKLRAP